MAAASTGMLNENGEQLWLSLLALGFQEDTERLSYAKKTKIAAKRIQLGASMFAKPNKDAFHIVIRFLLVKLDPTRFREAYRDCWPVLGQKEDAEFRKVTSAWIREIRDAAGGSKVVPSLLLTPGGHRFVRLMLDLAKHVMLQDMRTFTTDGSWVPEAVVTPTSSLDMEKKRSHLLRKRFLKVVVDQDRLLNEYHTQEQLTVKTMRDLKAQCAKFDEQLECQNNESLPEEALLMEKIEKVRSLWSTIDETLATVKENQNAIESVSKGEVDQYKLDGTDRVLNIPNVLLERIKQLQYQLKSGNPHEDGELNLLCVMELMNHALQLLKEERGLASRTSTSVLNLQHLQKQCHQMDRMVQDLALMREKISEEEVRFSGTIREQEAGWDQKWMETLKETPLASFLIDDPVYGFLLPKTLNSEDEDGYRSSDLSHDSKFLESATNDILEDSVLGLSTFKRCTQSPAPIERQEEAPVHPQASKSNVSLQKLSISPPCKPVKTRSVKASQVAVKKKPAVHSEAHVRTKTQILNMEHENLADQFADALAAASPPEGNGNGLELEDLLDNLQRNPFSTKKQLPRTPESLIVDVKRSWQKALREDEAAKLQMATFNDSIKREASPLREQCSVFSPDGPSTFDTSSIIFPGRSHSSQHRVLQSTLLWDTFNVGSIDGRAVPFSLEHETLPELPSFDSLNLSDDLGESEGQEQPLVPSPKVSPSPRRIQQVCRDDSAPQHAGTPEYLLSDFRFAPADGGCLKELDTEASREKEFSLDLDELGMTSPLNTRKSLPKLLTFSP